MLHHELVILALTGLVVGVVHAPKYWKRFTTAILPRLFLTCGIAGPLVLNLRYCSQIGDLLPLALIGLVGTAVSLPVAVFGFKLVQRVYEVMAQLIRQDPTCRNIVAVAKTARQAEYLVVGRTTGVL